MYDQKIEFVNFDVTFLDLSWSWLHDPEIKALTSTPDFTRQQQQEFYNSLPRDDYKVWGICCGGDKIGVVGLKNITDLTAEYFGYIGNKEYWNKGISLSLFDLIKSEANLLNVCSIYLHVTRENVRAIKAYMKNGFSIDECKSSDRYIYMSIAI